MNTKGKNIDQAYDSFSQRLARSNESSVFISTLFGLCNEIGQKLETLDAAKFSKAWLLHSFANEVLRYSIEDDYININDIRPLATDALQKLLKSENWIDSRLKDFLNSYHKIAVKEVIPAKQVELSIPTFNGGCRIVGWIADPNQPLIQVSSKSFPFIPVLEDSLTNPVYAQGVVNAFAENLVRLKEREGISFLCFIEKGAGPIGALSMLSPLVSELSLPACIYRGNHWSKRTKLSGRQPQKTDRIAIVYDLFVTGDGIRQAAVELKMKFDATIVAAVVLFGYDSKKDKLVGVNGRAITLEAIGWYEDFEQQVKLIQSGGVTRTENIKVLNNHRRIKRSPVMVGGTVNSPSLKGEILMDRSPRWNRSFTSYSGAELRALKFRSVKEFEQAIRLCWRDPDLKGVPRISPDGITLIVPEAAVPYFKVHGLRFRISEVLKAADLPLKELAEMRRKYGM